MRLLCLFIFNQWLWLKIFCRKEGNHVNIVNKKMKSLYLPITELQKKYTELLTDPKIHILLGVGPAGSGKTLFACNQAIEDLKSGIIKKIVITRPIVSVDEDLGFLPGTIGHKMDPWMRPILDVFMEYYSHGDIHKMLHDGVIEISPLAYMRGRTFKHSFVLADEMQNSSPNQMLMMLTRVGTGSKLVITGDLNQSDRGIDNGLADVLTKLNNRSILETVDTPPYIRYIQLSNTDIQRSAIVNKVVELYSVPQKLIVNTNEVSKKKMDVNEINKIHVVDELLDAALIPKRPLK
jgi:phosphate starvation-inducible PhoH-like protein